MSTFKICSGKVLDDKKDALKNNASVLTGEGGEH